MQKQYNNILVIKMSALGDIIHALPSLYALRQLYPKAHISWLVEPQFAEILPGKPFIDEKIIFYKNDLKKKSLWQKLTYLKNLRQQLHAHKFDLVIDLQGLMKSSLIALLSGCSNRIGYCEMREGSFLVTKAICGENSKNHVVQRYLDVIRYLGAKVDEVKFPLPDFADYEEKMFKMLTKAGINGQYVVFFPGARWQTKEWPLEHYVQLAKKFIEQDVAVVISGGNADKEKGLTISKEVCSPKIFDAVGKTSIIEVAGLVKKASACIGGDTGPMHIAAAVGVPTISLFGPVSPERTSAYGPFSKVVRTTAECAPCFQRKCPKVFICMDLISTQEVFNVCRETIL